MVVFNSMVVPLSVTGALVLLLAVASTYALPASTPKSSRWWFQTHTPEFTTQALSIVTKHRTALTGVYIYNGVSVNQSAHLVCPSDAEIYTKVAPFLLLNLTVGIVVTPSQEPIQNGAIQGPVVQQLAAMAKRNKLSSLMLDYEPKTNITQLHAEAYARFITALTEALHVYGVELDICVSNWSILTRFFLYASTGVDSMMSMASTYYGNNITANKYWVTSEMQQGVSSSQLRVGIGSTNSIYHKWDYKWNRTSFLEFTGWAQKQGVQNIDLWRTDLDSLNATGGTAPWIYDELASFLAQ